VDVYFLRHGDAADSGERPLSPKGRRQAQTAGEWLKARYIGPDAILCSPLLRARETAEIVGKILGVTPSVETLLDSGAHLDDISDLVQDFAPDDTVILVGHEPDFSRAIAGLIGGGKIDVGKASVAWVACKRVRSGDGELRWLVPNELMG